MKSYLLIPNVPIHDQDPSDATENKLKNYLFHLGEIRLEEQNQVYKVTHALDESKTAEFYLGNTLEEAVDSSLQHASWTQANTAVIELDISADKTTKLVKAKNLIELKIHFKAAYLIKDADPQTLKTSSPEEMNNIYSLPKPLPKPPTKTTATSDKTTSAQSSVKNQVALDEIPLQEEKTPCCFNLKELFFSKKTGYQRQVNEDVEPEQSSTPTNS